MRHFTPFKSATYLLVLFCIAHTAGGMLSEESLGSEADAVFAQMKAVQFAFNGSPASWYGFWFGFGLTASVFLLLSAFVSWQLDKVPSEAWPSVAPIAWSLVAAQAVNTYLGYRYFFLGPAIFGVCITSLLAYGAYRKSRAPVGQASLQEARTG
jgi:hypothetical protein